MSSAASQTDMSAASKGATSIFRSATTTGCAARLGTLTLAQRKPMQTPDFVALTSRGTVPHLTPDNVRAHVSSGGAYFALEDFIERTDPPVMQSPRGSGATLHSFTGFPQDMVSVLSARRTPAVNTPVGNSTEGMSVYTSTGFRQLSLEGYTRAVEALRPDIVVSLADLPHTSRTPASKKLLRMVERTEEWTEHFLSHLATDEHAPAVFVPLLPVEHPVQWQYLKYLSEDAVDRISGLAVYDVNLLPEITEYSSLASLPKLSLDPPLSPHQILRQISLGIDLFSIPFVNSISDAGIALSFTFPPPPSTNGVHPLGLNMWAPEHSIDLSPLVDGCKCYACSKHHRAYLQHLLNAREMLGWTLLQVHNHQAVSTFFAGVRESLAKGFDVFEEQRQQFLATYEPELPAGTGERPRARGYHFKTEAGQSKLNPAKPWSSFEGAADAAEAEAVKAASSTLTVPADQVSL